MQTILISPTFQAAYICLGHQNLKEFFDINYKPAFEALSPIKKERKGGKEKNLKQTIMCLRNCSLLALHPDRFFTSHVLFTPPPPTLLPMALPACLFLFYPPICLLPPPLLQQLQRAASCPPFSLSPIDLFI